MTQYILDILIGLCLTQSLGTCHAPELPHSMLYIERSVWGNYTGLYKLQRTSEKCSRLNTCPGLKAQLTVAPVLLKYNATTNNQTKGL